MKIMEWLKKKKEGVQKRMKEGVKKTYFGKYIRGLRAEKNENLRQMADKLEVSSAFLSAVEVGKKLVPKDWISKIVNLYGINEKEENELRNAIDKDNKRTVIEFNKLSTDRQELSMMFARTINTANQKTLEELREILDKCE